MLEDARPRERAVLRDVTDNKGGDSVHLCEAQKLDAALAHLADAARRARHIGAKDRLNRVDDEKLRFDRFDMRRDALKVRLADDEELVRDRAEPVGSHAHLAHALLARHIEHAPLAARDLSRHAKRQARLADAGIADDQDHRARDHTAAQHAVELARARQEARHVRHGDLADGDGARAVGKAEAQPVAR